MKVGRRFRATCRSVTLRRSPTSMLVAIGGGECLAREPGAAPLVLARKKMQKETLVVSKSREKGLWARTKRASIFFSTPGLYPSTPTLIGLFLCLIYFHAFVSVFA
ncbi:hypothetical protein VIGAN_03161800 [Vigna angularis var. angularis]|uniref:Uncharacterized protein n=1 Tax=Vigna angularis var. angularis TaxID=157739 RepID=A0A0S3RMC5_PHAAN|nr:hypothetical protein VIGAN_03161800 [Vigna angularis var. angularis]